MITVLSPSKTLDYESTLPSSEYTQPSLLDHSKKLIRFCQELSQDDIAHLMKISPKLAELNYGRFQQWSPSFTLENSRQAVFAFKGDVYEGLEVDDFSQDDLVFLQSNVRILSGLYGLLRPLDLVQPYRLEMGIKLKNERGKDLYQFWGEIITETLNALFENKTERVLINLSSNEYFKAIKQTSLNAKVIHPIFLDESKGTFKIISFYAKRARGMMARYIIKHQIENSEQIKSFDLGGYRFDEMRSNENEWFFVRSVKERS